MAVMLSGCGRYPRNLFRLVFFGITVLALLGCGDNRRAARVRAQEALIAPSVIVSDGQAGVLNVGTNYAAILPRVLISGDIQYTIFMATNGVLPDSKGKSADGKMGSGDTITVFGIAVRLMSETATSTKIELDNMGDTSAGLALAQASNLPSTKVATLVYKRRKELNVDDAMKAMALPTK